MFDKSIKVLPDGSMQELNVDGITYRHIGRNIKDIVDINKYIKENGIRRIEIDKKAIEHLKVV